MTHKSFYEAAAAEVAAGHLDSALWIKVNAELPDADDNVRQAKYIALRAQEMAGETTKRRMMNLWQRIPRWAKITCGVAIIWAIVGSIIQST